MAVRWEISDMRVETSPGDHTRDSLFANGQMQVPVFVSIQALKPNTTENYTLSAAELNTIKLVDYFSPTTQLSAPWTYSGQENEFHHVLPSTASNESPQTDGSNQTAAFQKKTWWVSTSKVEHKNIGASIRAPDGTVYHTGGGGPNRLDSHVTITGINPVHYNMSNVQFDREDTKNGRTINGNFLFDQDNYYFSSKVHRFQKVQIRGHFFNPANDPPIERCYLRVSRYKGNPFNSEQSHLHYLWLMGSQQTKQAGNKNARADITINQRQGALCFTRFTLEGMGRLYPDGGGWFTNQFTIYDQYGNWGNFEAGHDGSSNLITMSAVNSLLVEKSSASENFTPFSPEEAASLDLED
ncbi:hypothetical protein Asppvi_008483 [Aspergillus pseudoviridinutans]|uniref:Uncharacterized protein n=1 Tax=Aspergillus pseudoviridinutans TaxID=1517512 RepID=A0A9P3BKS3_9EURO|nr:uncharacterized protein Asppvi_008483 [Aspergillus pseudoviridinutans]GIJ89541.1 hypothetical protein Asppvi_008483 [Aspergillus pseudoviridinutans]